jgi:hypothetical protein
MISELQIGNQRISESPRTSTLTCPRACGRCLRRLRSGPPASSLLDPRPVLSATPFLWIAEIGCPTPEFSARTGKEPVFSVLVASGAIHVSNPVRGSRPLQINRVRILDNFTGMYSESHTGSANEFLVGARCGYPPLPFFHRPFPFIAAIHTNAGAGAPTAGNL